MLTEQLNRLLNDTTALIDSAGDTKTLYGIRVAVLGKNGSLTGILRGLKDLKNEERPVAGKLANDVRETIERELAQKEERLSDEEMERRLLYEKVDLTLDKKPFIVGKIHPLNAVLKKSVAFFVGLGFRVEESREIETVYYNFDALNTAPDHPARDAQDTFFITQDILLRSQTSTGQIRVMEKTRPPIRIISPGRVYRSDEADATHTPCFNQIEGLVVDKGVTMCDLKAVLESYAKFLFSDCTKIRFRPSYFPFTEPSVEVDASCPACHGSGCRICKGTGWIEILGAGMVNRNVLKGVGIDSDVYTGYAFGMGLNRITAIIHGITDARVPFEGDVRFLKQF
ncbi:MAG: phenylalanine--tRNA ligase subunit alpha [Firmicutes bacterium]|nr:phenylalanine--tRNA ligase subunit alpha [Bacillota bacterium]